MKTTTKHIAIAATMMLAMSQIATAQTKIKLARHIEYDLIISDTGDLNWERSINILAFDGSFYQAKNQYYRPRHVDGIVEVTGYSGKIFSGTWKYIDGVEGTVLPRAVSAFYPAVEALKTIRFFDKNGNIFIEDTFEYAPLNVFGITKTSENTFVTANNCNIYISSDKGESWRLIRDKPPNIGTFSINNVESSNPNIVIVGFTRDRSTTLSWGVALWANNPEDYVFEFADVDIPGTQVSSNVPGQQKKPPRKPNKRGKKR